MTLIDNKTDVRRVIACLESADCLFLFLVTHEIAGNQPILRTNPPTKPNELIRS